MNNKLTFKLITIIVASITLIAAIMAPIYFYLQPKVYIEQETKYVSEFAKKLKAVEPFEKDALKEFFDNANVDYRVYVFDENFEPIFTSFELGNNQKFLKKLFGDKLERFEENAEPYFAKVDDEPAVRLYTRCNIDNNTYYINIKDSLSGVDVVFDFSNRILSYVIVGYIIVCSIILFLAISPMVKSIRKVTTVAKSISENNLSLRYDGKVHKDEIGELTLSINKMADTIQENINNLENYNFILREDNNYMKEFEESRRMLLCSITHDLKTPLAVISSQVEMISNCKEQEKKDYYYQSAMEEISKMSKMLSEVLQMTVSEHHIISKKTQLINISELITQLCDSHTAYIKSHNLELKKDISPNLNLNTIKEYVEFVFRNYLSNAVQNADRNSVIAVSLKEHEDGIRLSIENHGQQIPDETKDKVWTKSFTTLPEGNKSTGLGLYIVKEISLIEHTECGFDNFDNGVRFWFNFIDCPAKD